MFGLTGLRLGGAIAGIIALAAIVGGLVWLIRDRDRLQAVEDRGIACETAVQKRTDPTASCPQAISDAATQSQRFIDCDAALKAGDLYTVRAACSAEVKRRDAQATTLAADKTDLTRQLAEARDAIAGAITRAETRAAASNRKDRNAQAAIAAAPRSPDGRIRCDDRCLRDLAGD